MNNIKKIIITLIAMLQFSAIAKAQQDNIADSLLYYLNGIKGDKKNDSIFYNHAINILYKNKKKYYFKILQSMKQLTI